MTADDASRAPLRGEDVFPRRLPAEVAQWQADGLISREQADAILERYGLSAEVRLPGEPAAPDSLTPGSQPKTWRSAPLSSAGPFP